MVGDPVQRVTVMITAKMEDSNGDTTRSSTGISVNSQSNVQSPTAINEDQFDRNTLDKTLVPTQNADNSWLVRQYILPTVVMSKDDGIGELRE